MHNSLIYAGQIRDSGCNIIFTKDNVEVNKYVKSVISGICDQQSLLWRVYLKELSQTNYKAACNHEHETSNLKELINYLHVMITPIF
jgi:hypothetical protein